ncbi:MAG: phosphate regulon sensor histidine kinase PhoR [Proteobacteria bacterium]|nr:phosphate regulon sensor histidine kinase PhoR [Pseudomonadota bacterium]
MHPLLARALLALALVLAGGLLGGWAGQAWHEAAPGVLAGAVLGLALFGAQDAWRAGRLLQWLRGPQDEAAPRDTGLWGELGYRVERSLRQRDQALRSEGQRLAQFLSAIEASPNGVVLLDAQDQIEWCSHVAADHFGLDPQRDRLQRITNLVRAPSFVAYLQGSVAAGEALILPAPRAARTLSVTVRAYGDGQRLLLTQDITDRERSDAMRRDFVANVSHEIRTPLTVLAGFVETMASLPLSDVERQRMLALMTQQTARMQALVADLLTLARLEGSPRPATDQWVDAAALLEQALADGRALSGGRHRIELSLQAAGELAGNRGELLSAVGNLVNNAVRYTPDGGRIGVRFALRDGGGAEIEVSDDGPGIAREHLPRLAQRFYRVDGSRSRETGGTGLGLAIVKHVVQRHGGELAIDSEPGKGSRFRLLLPPARLRAAETLPRRDAATPTLPQLT